MYEFSRAIYRELADQISVEGDPRAAHKVLRSCERAIERLAYDRHYFAKPARTLFNDIRVHFPVSAQHRVWGVVDHYVRAADEFLAQRPPEPAELRCRATTRKGTACQRVPLPDNGYCPSHQHLAETEDMPAVLAA